MHTLKAKFLDCRIKACDVWSLRTITLNLMTFGHNLETNTFLEGRPSIWCMSWTYAMNYKMATYLDIKYCVEVKKVKSNVFHIKTKEIWQGYFMCRFHTLITKCKFIFLSQGARFTPLSCDWGRVWKQCDWGRPGKRIQMKKSVVKHRL